ncbi:type IV conjugative transfer system protein TraC [Enterobacter hormaechei]|nr:type IV conjugative transfer system protein TraC [Enterobacter hormaechei]
MSFVDNLMDMLKNGKEEDGAATARENLSQTWGYPSLVAALPYRYYDDINEIFVNAGSAGFIMEAAPLPGANEQVMAALDDMLRKKLPRQTPVTVIMLASKCVGERIDRGVSNDMWKGGMADHLNKITRAFWQRSALHGLANERDYPLYLRNYRIFLVYGQPLKRASQTQRVIDDLIQIRNTIRVSLGAARIDSVNVDVNGFLSAVREQMNYRQEQVLTSSGDYNEDEKLNRQVVDQGIGLDVYPSPASRKVRSTASLTVSLPASFRSRGVATSWALSSAAVTVRTAGGSRSRSCRASTSTKSTSLTSTRI